MKKYKIIIAYDGFGYQGWQSQTHSKTICDVMQNVFKKTFKEQITLIGASRTDAHVHAFGQVALFKTNLNIDPIKLQGAWNNALPLSISIRSIHESPYFHPHHNVKHKIYRYTLFLKRPLPEHARYGWFYPFIDQVDLHQFKKNMELYRGTHDFRSFCKLEKKISTIRSIYSITMHQEHDSIYVDICGNSFLHNQIRRMVGCALEAARPQGTSHDYLKTLLEQPGIYDRVLKAAAHGLCLKEIIYDEIS